MAKGKKRTWHEKANKQVNVRFRCKDLLQISNAMSDLAPQVYGVKVAKAKVDAYLKRRCKMEPL